MDECHSYVVGQPFYLLRCWFVFHPCLDIATGGCLQLEARVIGGEVRLLNKGNRVTKNKG